MNEAEYAGQVSEAPMVAGQIGAERGYALDKLAASSRYRQPTVREQVQDRIAGLEKSLAEHKATLDILDAEPGVEKALNALRKIGV
jgi:hypothetical protein